MTSKDKHDRWVMHFWSFGLAAVVIGFFAQGEMAFANPVHLATIGLVAGIAIICAHSVALADDGKGKVATAIAVLFAVAAGGLVTYEGGVADAAIQANVRRCGVIQDDMLAATPRRDDGPDLFQALGCKPQGSGAVNFPIKLSDHRDTSRTHVLSHRERGQVVNLAESKR